MPDNGGYPELPERFWNALTNERIGFHDHPDWQRRADRRALIHRDGWIYYGTVDGHAVWRHR